MHGSPFLGLFGVAIFIALGLVLAIWESEIRPILVPKAEIARRADELIAKFGHRARNEALNAEFLASQKCDLYQQGYWRRIREELARRERNSTNSSAK
jgi:hypothetical protein